MLLVVLTAMFGGCRCCANGRQADGRVNAFMGCANEFRQVLECGSPLPLFDNSKTQKRQRTAALQNLAEVPGTDANYRPL